MAAAIKILSDYDAKILYKLYPDLPKSYREGCPSCGGQKYVVLDGVQTPCNCKEQLALYKLYLDAGVGPTFQYLSQKDWHGDQTVFDAVTQYVNSLKKNIESGCGLLIRGDFGTGKSLLGAFVIKYAARKGYLAYMTTVADLMDSLKEGWKDAEFNQWYKNKIDSAQILLLDDLGRELIDQSSGFSDKYAKNIVESLLRTRTQQNRSTLITTNWSMDDLRVRYSNAFMSLLEETMTVIEFPESAVSYRPQAQRAEQGFRQII